MHKILNIVGIFSGNMCNCDQNIERWTEDSGYLSDLDTLPVKQLRFGDTGNFNEEGFYTLGPLRCYSSKFDSAKVYMTGVRHHQFFFNLALVELKYSVYNLASTFHLL